MAIGTITEKTVAAQGNATPIFLKPVSFAGDGAYATGGTADFQASVRADLGPALEVVEVISGIAGNYIAQYDKANDKLLIRQISDGAEVANATDLSGTTFNLTLVCR
jgi:hypothetical protein